MRNTSERILSLNDAADIMALSPVRMRQFVAEGRLPAIKLGKTWAVYESDLMEFAARERLVGRPGTYEVILIPGEASQNSGTTFAHVSERMGHRTACGREFTGAVVHRLGQTPSPAGARWCPGCKMAAPRYFVRHFSREGISG